MGIIVFSVYFLFLAVLLWADLIHTWSGALVVAIVGLVGAAAIVAAARATRT